VYTGGEFVLIYHAEGTFHPHLAGLYLGARALLFLSASPADTAYWYDLARKLAGRIYEDSRGDYYDVKLYRDSSGVYLLYHKRWYVVMPSGYKAWYRTPIALKLPDNTPDYFEDAVIRELDRRSSWKERLGEVVVSVSGCGLAVIGGLIAVMVSLQR